MGTRYPNSFRVDGIGDVHFAIGLDTRFGGMLPDWEMRSNIQSYTVPGSNPPIVVNDLVNHEASTVTWRLRLASLADYRKLLTMRGQVGRLYVMAGLQSHISAGVTFDGLDYDFLDDTTIIAVDRATPLRGGQYHVDVTFQRVQDTASYTVQPAMMLNFADVGTANPVTTPPVLRTPDDVYDMGLNGDVRPGGGRYGARAVRLLRDDSAYLNTANHGLADLGGTLAVRCRWTSEPSNAADVIRLGNVSTDGIRIWRREDLRVTARVSNVTDITSGHDATVATNDWVDIALTWGGSVYRLWIDGVRVADGSISGSPGVNGNQLIVGSNASGSRGDVAVDAVLGYFFLLDDERAMQIHRSWSWDWGTVTNE